MSHATLIFIFIFYFLSCIHVDTADLLNVTCTLVTTSVILRSIASKRASPVYGQRELSGHRGKLRLELPVAGMGGDGRPLDHKLQWRQQESHSRSILIDDDNEGR